MPYPPTNGAHNGAGGILYMNERHSDVAISVVCGEAEWRFPAHSLLLSSMSEVITNMLEVDMSEKSNKVIRITDSNPTTIKNFLRFVYMGEAGAVEWRDVIDLLSVAHKYQVEPLINICEKQLLQAISLSSVCLFHEIGHLYSLPTLVSESRKLILDGGFIIWNTEGFENMSKKSIEHFLSSNHLNMENEITVLNALKKWAISECSRRGYQLTEENIHNIMKPILRYIRFKFIHSTKRRFIPDSFIQHNQNETMSRVKFFVPPILHAHMTSLKFVVELGSFVAKASVPEPLHCLKFSCDKHLFILGFRIVGMFRNNFTFGSGSPMLILGREGNRNAPVQFDLSSIPWKGGASVGEYMWREIVAYFPHPARIDPFACYTLTVKYGNLLPTKWPRTRLENNNLTTGLGSFTVFTFGQCAGITEIFLLPAPPAVTSCNSLQD